MLMFNHSEKEDSLPRTRPQSNVENSQPRFVEISSSNPGTPIKVVEIKSSTPSLIATGWYPFLHLQVIEQYHVSHDGDTHERFQNESNCDSSVSQACGCHQYG